MRIRKKGYPELNFDGGSYEDAKTAAARIEAERKTGLFIDYTSGHRVNFRLAAARLGCRSKIPPSSGARNYEDGSDGLLATTLASSTLVSSSLAHAISALGSAISSTLRIRSFVE